MKQLKRYPVAFLATLLAAPLGATTLPPLSFADLVAQAHRVVVGEVTDVRTVASGQALGASGGKIAAPPTRTPRRPSVATAPGGVGVEGGRMLFTEVTLRVDRAILGEFERTLTLRFAGGEEDGLTVVVYGMPMPELGGRYLLFLREDLVSAAVPVVGVNQGFFRVVDDAASGKELLFDEDGDLVIGIEDDRIMVRSADARSGPGPRLADPPRETSGDTPAETGLEASRYWTSEEPGMPLAVFEDAVRSRREAE